MNSHLLVDEVTGPFWTEALSHRFVIQQCSVCQARQFPPRPYCIKCLGDCDWIPIVGEGTVLARTTVHIAVSSDFAPPYDVMLIELVEGPKVLSRGAAGGVSIGDRVRLWWRDRTEAPPLPEFRRIPQENDG